VHERRGKHQLLLHAARQAAGAARRDVSQPESGQQRFRARTPVRLGDAAEPGEELDVLGDGQVGVQAELLAHVADLGGHAIRVAHDRRAEHARLSGVGAQDRCEHPQQSRLPGAVGADQPVQHPFRNRQVHPVDGDRRAERTPQAPRLDRGRWTGRLGRAFGGHGRVTSTGNPGLYAPDVSAIRTRT